MGRIVSVDAVWLRCPLEGASRHVSDLGQIRWFDSVLVTIRTDDGLVGHGEAKAGVGSTAEGDALVAIIAREFAPLLVGGDPARIQQHWLALYSGTRMQHALRTGRSHPRLGRRGLHLSAISGVDLALWDLLGKSCGRRVVDLLGGPCRDRMPAYASGGWGSAERIGDELRAYVARGYRAVKMRVGAMDGSVGRSLERVRAARTALGPEIALMVDAHGTFTVPEAKRFCDAARELDLRWIEEPVSPDDRAGMAEVRRTSTIPIAAGESEATAVEFADLAARGAVDVFQPDLAIAGGLSEGVRIGAVAQATGRELAPHCWGSCLSLVAGATVAIASPAGTWIEVPMGGDPLLHELPERAILGTDGTLAIPDGPGFGLSLRQDVIERYRRPS